MATAIVKSSRRAFEILEAFEELRRPLGLSELARKLDYPVSSAAVLLKSLMQLGYLIYDSNTRSYFPTTRIASLGQWIWELVVDRDTVRLMERICHATGETVTLSTLSGGTVQYVHVVPSPSPLRYEVPVGLRRSVFVSAAGWALLGVQSDKEIEEVVRQANYHEGDRSKRVSLSVIMSRVRQVRSKGYAFSRNMIIEGGGSMAMAIPAAPRRPRMAIGLHGVLGRMEKAEVRIAHLLQKEFHPRACGRKHSRKHPLPRPTPPTTIPSRRAASRP
ncbi:MAG: IclR family transcriptional regulator [Verrucomicrobiaceae bacterium]